MVSEVIERLICKEVHTAISKAVEELVRQLSNKTANLECSYPPGAELSADERGAIRKLNLSPEELSAIRKLALDACAYPTFHLFSVIDGVGDPTIPTPIKDLPTKSWHGLSLSFKELDRTPQTFLHDLFYETAPTSTIP